MKITKDGFIWKIVTDEAKDIYNTGLFSLFVLNEDESESLILDHHQLNKALENGLRIGIEVGKIDTTQAKEIINNTGLCGVYWSVDDFEGRAIEMGIESYDETKFQGALTEMCSYHDATIGITWETVDFYLNEYCLK